MIAALNELLSTTQACRLYLEGAIFNSLRREEPAIEAERLLQQEPGASRSERIAVIQELQAYIARINIQTLPRTELNPGHYTLAGRMSLLGERILTEFHKNPNKTSSSLRTLEELVSLTIQAIERRQPLPILKEEKKGLPTPSFLRKLCCWCCYPMPVLEFDNEPCHLLVTKQPFGNYLLTIKPFNVVQKANYNECSC